MVRCSIQNEGGGAGAVVLGRSSSANVITSKQLIHDTELHTDDSSVHVSVADSLVMVCFVGES